MLPARLNYPRDRLAHILPALTVSGCYGFVNTLAQELNKTYGHALFFTTPLETVDPALIWQAQASGLDVIQTDRITEENLRDNQCTAAIFYNTVGYGYLAQTLPSVYYSYGVYDPDHGADIVVPCSKYACTRRRYATADQTQLNEDWIVPPAVNTRAMRHLTAKNTQFTVGVLTSGAYDKFPCELVIKLMSELPKDIRVIVTVLNKNLSFKNPGVTLALQDRARQTRGVVLAQTHPSGMMNLLLASNVVVCASTLTHGEPFGRLAIEGMALGKPVLCERRGAYQETVEHGVSGMLFDSCDELIEQIQQIKGNTNLATKLGLNARLWASWQDISVHIGKLKRILRTIGG